MKQLRFLIILFLLSFFTKAQTFNLDCDSIFLTNGVTYYGVITNMTSRVIKFNNCDTFGPIFMTVYLKDIKKLNYDKVRKKLEKQITQKETVKAIEKEDKLKPLVDTTKCFHAGIIPYQFLTRSSGVYVRYDFKTFALEYRPTYTYATNMEPQTSFPIFKYDNFYFQGINNSLIFYFPCRPRVQAGLMFSYKHWWHGKESIVNDNSQISSRDDVFFLKEIKSTVMDGLGLGLEFTYYRKAHKNFDFNFFWNAAITYFNSYSHVYSLDYLKPAFTGSPLIPSTYPYTETKNRFYFNLTCGFKLGYKKQLKK